MEPVSQPKSVVMHLPSVGEPPFSVLPPAAAPKDMPRASRSASSQEELPSPVVMSRTHSLNTPETVISTAVRVTEESEAKEAKETKDSKEPPPKETVQAKDTAMTVMEVARREAEAAKAEAVPEETKKQPQR